MESSAAFFQNRACEYFPCHEGVNPDDFNCLFCYCPLYALGDNCGGNFRYSESGTKVCTDCVALHVKDEGVEIVKRRFPELKELGRSHGGKLV